MRSSCRDLGLTVFRPRNEAGKRLQERLAEFLAYTSLLHAETSPMALAQEHRETEALIRSSGVPFVLLRNGWYTENYTGNIAAAIQHGAVLGPRRRGVSRPQLAAGQWLPAALLRSAATGMRPIQSIPQGFGPYYVEFDEVPGGFNFSGGNAQLDFQTMTFDWACG